MGKRIRRSGQTGVSFFAFQDIITSVTGILVLITVMLTFLIKEDALAGKSSLAEKGLAEELERQLTVLRDLSTKVNLHAESTQPDRAGLDVQLSLLTEQIKYWEDFQKNHPSPAKDASREAIIAGNIAEAKAKGEEYRRRIPLIQASITALEAESLSHRQRIEALKLENESVLKGALVLLPPDRSVTDKEPIVVIVNSGAITLMRQNTPVEPFKNVSEFQTALGRFNSSQQYFVFYNFPGGTPIIDDCVKAAARGGFDVGLDGLPDGLQLEIKASTPP